MTAEGANRPTGPKVHVGPVVALLLSLFILPGIGQILTARWRRGLIMAAWQISSWLLAHALISARLYPNLWSGAGPRFQPDANAFFDWLGTPESLTAILIVICYVAGVYLWTIIDSICYLIACRREKKGAEKSI